MSTRRGTLIGLGASILLASTRSGANAAPLAILTFDIDVDHATARSMSASPYDPSVVSVRDAVGTAVSGEPLVEQIPAIVADALQADFPGLVLSEPTMFGYGWRINPQTGELEYYCTGLDVLTVQLATPVEVRVRVSATRSD